MTKEQEKAIEMLESLVVPISAESAMDMAIDALKFDIDKYCDEHFYVLVEKDVWEDAKKALEQNYDCEECEREFKDKRLKQMCKDCSHAEMYSTTSMKCTVKDEIVLNDGRCNSFEPNVKQPCEDEMVSKGVLEQVMWERDIAIEQLHELGYELGQKIEPCKDTVNRDAVKEMICAEFVNPQDGMQEWRNAVNDVVENILHKAEQLPSVTPTQETAKWIDVRVGKIFSSRDYKCSKCGNILDFNGVNCGRGDANYCPVCGKKMVGYIEGK